MKSGGAARDSRVRAIFMNNNVIGADHQLNFRSLAKLPDPELCYYFCYAKFAEIAGAGEFPVGPNSHPGGFNRAVLIS